MPLLKATSAGWMRDNAMRLSAALALYTILSLAPLLVITAKVVGALTRDAGYARDHRRSEKSTRSPLPRPRRPARKAVR